MWPIRKSSCSTIDQLCLIHHANFSCIYDISDSRGRNYETCCLLECEIVDSRQCSGGICCLSLRVEETGSSKTFVNYLPDYMASHYISLFVFYLRMGIEQDSETVILTVLYYNVQIECHNSNNISTSSCRIK